jgi:hypothetical protein
MDVGQNNIRVNVSRKTVGNKCINAIADQCITRKQFYKFKVWYKSKSQCVNPATAFIRDVAHN